MSRKCVMCGYFNGNSCEAGVISDGEGCNYHYETLAKMQRERSKPQMEESHWYTKNGNYLLFYCSDCDAPSIRKTRYCPECGSRKDGEL